MCSVVLAHSKLTLKCMKLPKNQTPFCNFTWNWCDKSGRGSPLLLIPDNKHFVFYLAIPEKARGAQRCDFIQWFGFNVQI